MRFITLVVAIALAPTARPSPCITVYSSHVFGRDLPGVSEITNGAADNIDLGYAPRVGAVRTISAAEFARSAIQAGLGRPREWTAVCLKRAERRLSAAELQAALGEALTRPGEVRVVDFYRGPIATGPLRFALNGLQANGYWRGQAADGSPIWARIDPSSITMDSVQKDRPIEVEVRAGGAVLRLAATAEGGGEVGQAIMVRDTEGHRFRAVVSAAGKVVVTR